MSEKFSHCLHHLRTDIDFLILLAVTKKASGIYHQSRTTVKSIALLRLPSIYLFLNYYFFTLIFVQLELCPYCLLFLCFLCVANLENCMNTMRSLRYVNCVWIRNDVILYIVYVANIKLFYLFFPTSLKCLFKSFFKYFFESLILNELSALILFSVVS